MVASFSCRGRAPVPPVVSPAPGHSPDRARPWRGSVLHRPGSPPHDLASRRRAAAARLADDRSPPPGLHLPCRRSEAVHRVHRHRRGEGGGGGGGGGGGRGRGGGGGGAGPPPPPHPPPRD